MKALGQLRRSYPKTCSRVIVDITELQVEENKADAFGSFPRVATDKLFELYPDRYRSCNICEPWKEQMRGDCKPD